MKSISLRGYCPRSRIEGNVKKLVHGWGSFGVLFEDGELLIEGFESGGKSHVLEVCLGWDVLYLIYKDDPSILHRLSLQSFQEDQTIPLPEGEVQEVSTSEVELLVLMKDGNLWRYTLEWECILGPDSDCKDILGMMCILQVACGVRHHCALTNSGVVFCWGCNLHNECGFTSKEDVVSPQFVSPMGGLIITSISAGLHHTIASTESGDVYSWGSNANGQLGLTQSSSLPTLIEAPILEDQVIVKVCCGSRHTLVLSKEGVVFGWGWNKFGQLSEAIGDVKFHQPIEVSRNVKDIDCGRWHSMFLNTL